MAETVLVLNAGSSSIKFELFEIGPQDRLASLFAGQIEGIGVRPRLLARTRAGAVLAERTLPREEANDVEGAMAVVERFLDETLDAPPIAAGHRVVHGGPVFSAPVAIDEEVLATLETFVPLAPLHQPYNLALVRALRRSRPDLFQVACFDTAFHRGHPALADCFALPDWLWEEGVRRYGFHGLSYEYVAARLRELDPELAEKKVIVAHLGSGCSMCALRGGKSVESTMGFTALDGLPMGTRPGQLDPGVVLYLAAAKGMDPEAIQHFLYHDCGLKGLSGISNDLRVLLSSADPKAAFALEFFVYKIAQMTGWLAAALEGLDGFVFTAGIGENSPTIREAVAHRLRWLGMELDPHANAAHGPLVSTPASRVRVYVVPTDEELVIARHTLALLRRGGDRR
ncbi:MAG: acetate/propionate family kinase [Geminicoccaceae bacterium]|nr:acetate/propionate family kinase [Geminicoccaceae bacterium]MDW8123602.1 acetate/propionate family kinase [Geminicoccaceae bacterium]MDW8339943.1 acetate/propionate family kinase [Geminicoccaceae bacterium]